MESLKHSMDEILTSDYGVTMNLTIRSIEKRDLGGYQCSALNALGTANGVVRLQGTIAVSHVTHITT